MFKVTTAASSRALLTTAEAKSALGITDSSQDTKVDAYVLRVSDLIAKACSVPADGIAIPTLLSERVTETFRLPSMPAKLVAARKPITSVVSVSIDGIALDTDEFEVDAVSLTYLDGEGDPQPWPVAKIVAVYDAGIAANAIPADLKLAAETALREQWSAQGRDPLLKSETTEGLGRFDYWVMGGGSTANTSAVSPSVLAMLSPYRYYPV